MVALWVHTAEPAGQDGALPSHRSACYDIPPEWHCVYVVQSGSILQSLQSEVVRRFSSGSPPPSSTALMAILHFIVGAAPGTGFLITLQNTLKKLGASHPEGPPPPPFLSAGGMMQQMMCC